MKLLENETLKFLWSRQNGKGAVNWMATWSFRTGERPKIPALKFH